MPLSNYCNLQSRDRRMQISGLPLMQSGATGPHLTRIIYVAQCVSCWCSWYFISFLDCTAWGREILFRADKYVADDRSECHAGWQVRRGWSLRMSCRLTSMSRMIVAKVLQAGRVVSCNGIGNCAHCLMSCARSVRQYRNDLFDWLTGNDCGKLNASTSCFLAQSSEIGSQPFLVTYLPLNALTSCLLVQDGKLSLPYWRIYCWIPWRLTFSHGFVIDPSRFIYSLLVPCCRQLLDCLDLLLSFMESVQTWREIRCEWPDPKSRGKILT